MKQFLFILLLAISACKTTQTTQPTVEIPLSKNYSLNGKIYTSMFQQKAAEYRALCYQAYNIAKMRVDNYQPKTNLPKAIITDIDETLLDNSPYAVKQGLNGKEYDLSSWQEWTALGIADTLAGAGSLLHYLASKNVEVFYVTNREGAERAGTINNLKRFGLPFADEAHLLTRDGVSSKEGRRQSILKTHEVILYMGDNLSDFSTLFDKKPFDERRNNTDASAADFGNKFIILPNANYGDWEGALYNYNYRYSQAQKDSVMKVGLKVY